jgi:hypothetical protein
MSLDLGGSARGHSGRQGPASPLAAPLAAPLERDDAHRGGPAATGSFAFPAPGDAAAAASVRSGLELLKKRSRQASRSRAASGGAHATGAEGEALPPAPRAEVMW